MAKDTERQTIHALRVSQWLESWNEVLFDRLDHRRKPSDHFYLFSLSATQLKLLTGIYRRSDRSGQARVRDLGIQRAHNKERSEEIRKYVRRGYPWSTLSRAKQESREFDDLYKPGWLPTAIVLNILLPEDTREGRSVHRDDIIEIEQNPEATCAKLLLPRSFSHPTWALKGEPPLEVIDGQHRLWAFEDGDDLEAFELPVVAFHGLDLSWQAYLFYTINIKPKKINTSLAFDLYPLLRTADWLERAEEVLVYKESRAQELTEALWSFPESPWYRRIDMLGEKGRRQVTQAAWIRSLLATLVKSFEGPGVRIGGIFGAPVGKGADAMALGWNRSQQSAFLIFLWQELYRKIAQTNSTWATQLREQAPGEEELDAAFAGRSTLLNSDQGVRGVLAVTNDCCFVLSDDLRLAEWQSDTRDDGLAESAISEALASLKSQEVGTFLTNLAGILAEYDWRSSKTQGLSEQERRSKARFRGGTGYKEIRVDLLRHLANSGYDRIAQAATEVLDRLGLRP